MKIQSLLKSRRFWAAVAGVVSVVAADMLGVSEDRIMEVAGIAIAWILGDSLRKTE